MKLSIIIPIYNVEKYIVDCLESVLIQIEDDIEVICINDGTQDKSMEIARSIVAKYNKKIQDQFVFFDQKNLGLSSARNTGIDISKGEYISFLDSDDMISTKYISTILSIISENEYDIIDFNLMTSLNEIVAINSEGINDFNSIFKRGMWFACARVIKKSFLGNDRFTPDIYYEDLCLIPKLYIKSRKIKHIYSSLYWYRVNPNGITLSRTQEADIKTVNSFEKILKNYLYEYKLFNNENKRFLSMIICQTYFLLCVNACRRISLSKAICYFNLYNSIVNKIFLFNKKSINFNKRIYTFLYFKKLYLLIYKVYCQIKYR